MILKNLRNAVAGKVGRQILTTQKHSPVLLFGTGVVGFIGTIVLANRATLKLDDLLKETTEEVERVKTTEHEDYTDADRKKDLLTVRVQGAVKIGKLYAPAIALGVISIAALTGSHVILTRRNVGLAAAYATVDKTFKEYRDRVVSELGKDKDAEFRYGTEEREVVVEKEDGTTEIQTVTTLKKPSTMSEYVRVFDESNPNWQKTPMHNQMFLQCQQNTANDLLNCNGHVFLNEVFDLLGYDRTPAGAVTGWVKGDNDCDGHVDFGVFSNGRYEGMRFAKGEETSVWLEFNVQGEMFRKI